MSEDLKLIGLQDIYAAVAEGREVRPGSPSGYVRQNDISAGVASDKLDDALFSQSGNLDPSKMASTVLSKGLKDSKLSSQVFDKGILFKVDFSDLVMTDCTFEGTRLVGCSFRSGLFDRIRFKSCATVTATIPPSFPSWLFWALLYGILVLLYRVVSSLVGSSFSIGASGIMYGIGIVDPIVIGVLLWEYCRNLPCQRPGSRNAFWDYHTEGLGIVKDRSLFKSLALNSLARVRDITFDDATSPVFERYIRQQAICDERWEAVLLAHKRKLAKALRCGWLILIAFSTDSGRSFLRLFAVGLLLTLCSGITLNLFSNLPEKGIDPGTILCPTCGCKADITPDLNSAFFMFEKPDGMESGIYTAFYYTLVTISTLGYGDVTPLNMNAQIFSIFLTVLGYVLLGLLISIAYMRVRS